MKKTTTVNIGGVLFQIDEDAYQVLEQYLSRIESSYYNTSEGKDVLKDIENRLAELLQVRTQSGSKIIVVTDVNWAISTLGRPEDIGGPRKSGESTSWQQPNY